MSAWFQKELVLQARARGFHLITHEIESQLPELKNFTIGLAHVFILHTSASLTINENADPDVRVDMEQYFSRAVPENAHYFVHTIEGPDDMPAHIKASMMGSGVTIPVRSGSFVLGTWQGFTCANTGIEAVTGGLWLPCMVSVPLVRNLRRHVV